MSGNERYLLIITKNKSSMVLECPDSFSMENLKLEAETNGADCKQISIEDFYPKYRGYRYFDLKNPSTKNMFSILEAIKILDTPLEEHGEAENIFGGNIFH